MNEIERVLAAKLQAEKEINVILKKFKDELPPHVHLVRRIEVLTTMGEGLMTSISIVIE